MANLANAAHRWRIHGTVSATTVDVYLDVAGPYEWQRPEPARMALDPCGASPTLVIRSDGTLPKRKGRPTFRVPAKSDRATILSALQTVYQLRGPWNLATPTETFNFVVDPTQGAFAVQNAGLYLNVPLGVQEV